MFSKGIFLDLLLYIMLLNFPLLKFWGPESIHNIYNVPFELEPERAAKARRAVVASRHRLCLFLTPPNDNYVYFQPPWTAIMFISKLGILDEKKYHQKIWYMPISICLFPTLLFCHLCLNPYAILHLIFSKFEQFFCRP